MGKTFCYRRADDDVSLSPFGALFSPLDSLTARVNANTWKGYPPRTVQIVDIRHSDHALITTFRALDAIEPGHAEVDFNVMDFGSPIGN